MKGAVAASLAAVQGFLTARPKPFSGSISFLITGDEEGPAINGTRKVLGWLGERGEKPDFCVLGECTSEATVGDTIMAVAARSVHSSRPGCARPRGLSGKSEEPVACPDRCAGPIEGAAAR